MRLAAHRSDDAEPLGRVVQRKSDDEDKGQPELASGRRLPDRQAFGEIVEADAQCDEERQPVRRREARDRSRVERADVRGTRSQTAPRAPREPKVVIHEAHQTDRQRSGEDGGEPGEVRPVPRAAGRFRQRGLDRLDPFREHVPEQEEEYAGRAGIEERPYSWRGAADPAHGQTEEDGETGDRAERQNLARAHQVSNLRCDTRGGEPTS